MEELKQVLRSVETRSAFDNHQLKLPNDYYIEECKTLVDQVTTMESRKRDEILKVVKIEELSC